MRDLGRFQMSDGGPVFLALGVLVWGVVCEEELCSLVGRIQSLVVSLLRE